MTAENQTSKDQGDASRRGSPRRPVDLTSQVIREDGSTVQVIVLDISATGALLIAPIPLPEREPIALDLPGTSPIAATVQWSGAGICGCRFAVPLPKAVLSSALLKSGFVPPDSDAPSASSEAVSDDDMSEAGQRIMHARTARQWSQSDLADALGVSKTTVSNWEAGKARPRPEIGKRLNALLLVAEQLETSGSQGFAPGTAEAPDIAGEVRRCKQIIAEVAGVSAEQVHISIDF